MTAHILQAAYIQQFCQMSLREYHAHDECCLQSNCLLATYCTTHLLVVHGSCLQNLSSIFAHSKYRYSSLLTFALILFEFLPLSSLSQLGNESPYNLNVGYSCIGSSMFTTFVLAFYLFVLCVVCGSMQNLKSFISLAIHVSLSNVDLISNSITF